MGDRDVQHRGGVWWHEAPIPPADHECWVQTSGWLNSMRVERCACGGTRLNRRGDWFDRNTRTPMVEARPEGPAAMADRFRTAAAAAHRGRNYAAQFHRVHVPGLCDRLPSARPPRAGQPRRPLDGSARNVSVAEPA